jgi:DNA-binding protein H-NS
MLQSFDNRENECGYACGPLGHPQTKERSSIMAKTYADIQKEIESLQKAADALRDKEVAGVIQRIKDAIAIYDLTAQDLGFGRRPGPQPVHAAPRGKAGMYRDVSGKTWSGRGRRPGWVIAALAAGKTLDELRA